MSKKRFFNIFPALLILTAFVFLVAETNRHYQASSRINREFLTLKSKENKNLEFVPDQSEILADSLMLIFYTGTLSLVCVLLIIRGTHKQRKTLNEKMSLQVRIDRVGRFVKHFPGGIVLIEKDQITFNKEVENISGYTNSDIPTLDQWFQKLYSDPEHAREQYETHKKIGLKARRNVKITDGLGNDKWVELALYKDNDTELWLLYDISKHVELEKNLEEQNRLLKQIAFLQSHQLRKPVANLLGILDILQSDSSSKGNPELFDFVKQSALELDDIVRDLVRFTHDGLKSIEK